MGVRAQDGSRAVKNVMDELGLASFPKTSGATGLHILAPIRPELGFPEVRRFAKALAQEVERRIDDQDVATTTWKVADRRGVFVDFGQNSRDRTIASAYSIRPTPDARASAPLAWKEVPRSDPAGFTLQTMPKRVGKVGDLTAGMWRRKVSLLPRFEQLDHPAGRSVDRGAQAERPCQALRERPARLWTPRAEQRSGNSARQRASRPSTVGSPRRLFERTWSQVLLIGAVAEKACAVLEAVSLELVVADLRLDRVPVELFALRPAALYAGDALVAQTRGSQQLRQGLLELAPHRRGEAGAVPDEVELPVVAVEAEQERGDAPVGLFAPAEADDHAIGRAVGLDLHDAFA